MRGRNGSGKSSFAEALEFAVTGEGYRWKDKASLWADSWRNLHHGLRVRCGQGSRLKGPSRRS
ncbi:ATP-binding protein [Rhodococcus sp. 06-418-5]|uniref:ATP-binding protein n=1 Tax=Rhodococcus sp. 06-418-5 TaxID=2022507 RepID=UPI0015C62B32|nr:hypothetical protein [Rhodococcus sp. 06-418-5]